MHDALMPISVAFMQGPLMLEMNVLPDVAAATSATMILFTSLVGSLVFISFGAIGCVVLADTDQGLAGLILNTQLCRTV